MKPEFFYENENYEHITDGNSLRLVKNVFTIETYEDKVLELCSLTPFSNYSFIKETPNHDDDDAFYKNSLLIYLKIVWNVFIIIGTGSLLFFLLSLFRDAYTLQYGFVSFTSLGLAFIAKHIRKKVKNK